MFFIRLFLAKTSPKNWGHRAHLFRYRAYFEGNVLGFVRARADMRALIFSIETKTEEKTEK